MATNYKPNSSSGTWYAPGSQAYDGSTTTSAEVDISGYGLTSTGQLLWSGSSVTGMTSVVLYVMYQGYGYNWNDDGGKSGSNGVATLSYSWDGATYYNLATITGGMIGNGGGSYVSYTLANYTGSTNLSTLRLQAYVKGGRYTDLSNNTFDGESYIDIFDVYAAVTSSGGAKTLASCSPLIFF